jgi:type I restriction enzyme R subunit
VVAAIPIGENEVTPARHTEAAFESIIEQHLLTHGYLSIPRTTFDRAQAIFPSVALDFIRATQPKEWGKLEALHGERTGEQVLTDLVKWLDTHGALATLRHGFKCYGRKLYVAFFQAAHRLNPELEAGYAANRVGLTRQIHFSTRSEQSLDVVLSLNGIPLVTLELKNPGTGQTVAHAQKQYKARDPRETIFEFKRRTLVHFAVDVDAVWMTTRLAGDATHFLPFNRGFEKGAGNPPDPAGRSYKTAYLWEEVLQRDSLLDLVARFIHLQVEEKRDEEGRKAKSESMIFPRYHQLQTVRELVDRARREGVGHNALVEHSAGSGKSNTIAWLTHRLASLHDEKNERVFDSVVVVTDRRVLDQQLQDSIYQFEHKRGVVQKIDEDSRQLAMALQGGVPIVITTLQKFPFVTKQIIKMAEERGETSDGTLATRRYAIIIDEAHSSQGGEAATELKGVLGGTSLREEARQRAQEEETIDFEELYRSMAKRGQQANLSFFAFTATPKDKTLKIFGSESIHRYTMRQAIEEGFILDVLRSYTTYERYYRLVQASTEDPSVERKAAARALARYLNLHPHNIAQKTAVMVEHFQAVTRHKIGGRAKAMVVTGSRLEAVRYKEGFDRYIRQKGYSIKTLVAFSGTVQDDEDTAKTWTEVTMNNGVRESELPEVFATPEYHVLLVAEKYQTGFDQPLLHTMYVDKRLAGIQAVQTLSRLNRIHRLKEDTFVLDFRNDREEIRAAFKDYYEGAELGEEADPARMYQIKAELDGVGVYLDEEQERFCAVYFKPRERQTAADHQAMNVALDPVVARFVALQGRDEPEADLWRSRLTAFCNLYAYLSQIIPYQDSDLEKLFVFLRHLSARLPRRRTGLDYQFDDEVRLEYYRLQKISEGSISLKEGTARRLDGPTEVGSGQARDEQVPLSQLIHLLNERFGTDFNTADQLFFDQIVETAMTDESLRQAAIVNPEDKFALVFKQLVEGLFIERMDLNEAIFIRYMNDKAFQKDVIRWMAGEAWRKLRERLPDEGLGLPSTLRLIEPTAEERYTRCVPLLPLKVAAGGFSEAQAVEDEARWVELGGRIRPALGLFVAQVVGESMGRRIPSGSWCLWRLHPPGPWQGKVVLVCHREIRDSELGGTYTVKVYDAEPVQAEDGTVRNRRILLRPDAWMPGFEPIVLDNLPEGELAIVAELVEVLG